MKKIETDIVILGAGLTGLTIADLVSKQGREVIVLEKEKIAGGLAKTIEFNGFRFDLGGHRLYFRNQNMLQYINEVVKNSLLHEKRKSSIFFNGKFLKYPPRILNLVSCDISNIIKFSLDALYIYPKRNNLSLKDWIIARMGRTIHNIYFKDYTQKVWGLGTELMSADWAEKRIGQINKWNLIKSLFREYYNIQENLPYFFYPKSGIGMICEGLKNRLNRNSKLFFDIELQKINHRNGRLDSIIYRDKSEEKLLQFKHIISTVPLKSLYELIFPLNSSDKEDLNRAIRYRNLILVLIILKQENVFDDHWIYFPQLDFPFARISEPKNWSEQMTCGSKTSLCIELFCSNEDKMWNEENKKIMAIVANSLQKLNISKEEVKEYFVLRVPFAYPLLYLGYQDSLSYVLKHLQEFKNLNLAGRTGTHSYHDMEECLIQAKELSEILKKQK